MYLLNKNATIQIKLQTISSLPAQLLVSIEHTNKVQVASSSSTLINNHTHVNDWWKNNYLFWIIRGKEKENQKSLLLLPVSLNMTTFEFFFFYIAITTQTFSFFLILDFSMELKHINRNKRRRRRRKKTPRFLSVVTSRLIINREENLWVKKRTGGNWKQISLVLGHWHFSNFMD